MPSQTEYHQNCILLQNLKTSFYVSVKQVNINNLEIQFQQIEGGTNNQIFRKYKIFSDK